MEFVSESTVRLVKQNASDVDVAHAAWVSNFGSEAETRDTSDVSKLINFLYSNRHMSPFEHGSFTFFVDTPIFVAREFMRHRTWSYNETSGRYKELDPRFYLAPDDRPMRQVGRIGNYSFTEGTDEQKMIKTGYTRKSYEASWYAYKKMLDAGVAKEVARNVLPVGTMTQFYATANPRNVMQFLSLRNDGPALKEIRDVAEKIEAAFAEAMPLTYMAYVTYDWRKDKAELERLRTDVGVLKQDLADLEELALERDK
jgi:thymidylate synthase (FAD)